MGADQKRARWIGSEFGLERSTVGAQVGYLPQRYRGAGCRSDEASAEVPPHDDHVEADDVPQAMSQFQRGPFGSPAAVVSQVSTTRRTTPCGRAVRDEVES